MAHKTLLSIDGGGEWFVGVSAYLASLDKAMGYTLMSHIDGGSGTSAGALLISLLMCGYSPADIDSVAIQEHKKMFDGVGFPQCLNLLRANKYRGKFAKSLLQKMLGDIKVKDVKKPIFLTGCNMATQEEIIFSHEYNSDWPLWKAALVSMSAPSYFPLIDGKYGDGGLVANNPAQVLLSGFCHQTSQPMEDIKILSFASSGRIVERKEKSLNVFTKAGWIKPVIDMQLKGNSRITHFIMKQQKLHGYLRLCPQLTDKHDYSLDDTKHFDAIRGLWYAEYRLTSNKVVNFLKGENHA